MTFPTPWTVHHNDDAYWVEAANGAKFGFVYFRRSFTVHNPSYHTEDEARRLATNIAKLPELLSPETQKAPPQPKLRRGPDARGEPGGG